MSNTKTKRPTNVIDQPEETTGAKPSVHKVAIIAPTCFYYQVPLFQTLATHPRMDLTVYFCSEEASRGNDVREKFKADGNWGIEGELLEGYRYKFLRNFSPWPSYLNSLVGLMNFGILMEIIKTRPDVVVLMSWMNPTWWLAVLACVVSGVPFLYLTDQNVQRDISGPGWKRWVKSQVLGRMLFRLTSGFLCAGTANRLLYEFYGVPEHKLIPFAFSWESEKLLKISDELSGQKDRIRAELGLPEDSYTILYCGRLSPEKSPMNLVRAYEKVDLPGKALVIVGDGVLRASLESYVASHGLESVYFFGFQNRREIPKFYVAVDVLVLPSDQETWGIVVNEAMCFGLPVITSDQVGAARDLVQNGLNGLSFPRGDIDTLAGNIMHLMQLSEDELLTMGANSRGIIEGWTERNLPDSLEQYLDLLSSGNQASRS